MVAHKGRPLPLQVQSQVRSPLAVQPAEPSETWLSRLAILVPPPQVRQEQVRAQEVLTGHAHLSVTVPPEQAGSVAVQVDAQSSATVARAVRQPLTAAFHLPIPEPVAVAVVRILPAAMVRPGKFCYSG